MKKRKKGILPFFLFLRKKMFLVLDAHQWASFSSCSVQVSLFFYEKKNHYFLSFSSDLLQSSNCFSSILSLSLGSRQLEVWYPFVYLYVISIFHQSTLTGKDQPSFLFSSKTQLAENWFWRFKKKRQRISLKDIYTENWRKRKEKKEFKAIRK